VSAVQAAPKRRHPRRREHLTFLAFASPNLLLLDAGVRPRVARRRVARRRVARRAASYRAAGSGLSRRYEQNR
jgi:hypothetical protein